MVHLQTILPVDQKFDNQWYATKKHLNKVGNVDDTLISCDPDGRDASWVSGEIKKGQEERYVAWLRKWSYDMDVMRRELSECCQFNLSNKFTILCPHLVEIGVGLELDIVEARSCFIYAAGCGSNEVSKLIIKSADAKVLTYVHQDRTEYLGCTALHCIVANGLSDVLDDLIMKLDKEDMEKLIAVHVEGSHFIKKMKVSSLALHLTCWNGNMDIFDKLIYHGAEVDAQDKPNGNTILHLLVELGVESPEEAKLIFQAVLRSKASRMWWCLKNNQDLIQWTAQDDANFKAHMLHMENYDGYTPLTLAAKFGAHAMIDYIVNIEGVHRTTLWHFGKISFAGYDMNEIDPAISQKDCTVRANILELLIYQNLISPKTLPIFSLPIIRSWVESMWKSYFYNFYGWFICLILYVVACYQLPVTFIIESRQMIQDLNQTNLTVNKVCFCDLIWASRTLQFYVAAVALGVSMTLFYEGCDALKTLFLTVMWLTRQFHFKIYNAPCSVILKVNIFRLVILISVCAQIFALMRLMVDSEICLFSTASAFIFGCYFFIFFLQGCDKTGYFGTIMHQVLFTDIINFGMVFVLMLIAFGGTIHLILFTQGHGIEGFDGLGTSIFTMFNLMHGFGTVPYFETVENNGIIIAIFVIFTCLTIILLINMLIAAMSDTYASLAPYREQIWIRNTASIILLMQRRNTWLSKKINKKVFQYKKGTNKWIFMIETTQPPTCV